MEIGTKIFFLFFGLSTAVLAKNNSGKRFFNFLTFFSIFFRIFLPGSSMNGIWDKIFFFSFLASLYPYLIDIMPELSFLIFFFYFCRNFLAQAECEWNSGLNFFSLFLVLSRPVLTRNNARMRFFSVFTFFAIFFGIFFNGPSMNGIPD